MSETPTAAGPGFINLRAFSAYSLLEGALPIKTLAKLAKADAQPALAITDSNNLFGALEFAEVLAAEGIQPIIGITLTLRRAGQGGRTRHLDTPIVLLAKDEPGYRNLMALTSAAYLDHAEDTAPHVTLDDLARHTDGLIALTGGPGGPVDVALAHGDGAGAAETLAGLAELFPVRLYVEIQRLPNPLPHEHALLALATQAGIPAVATNPAYFPAAADYDAHDCLLAIAEGRTLAEDDRRRLTPHHRFKSRAEMTALFADLPQALANSVAIAQRCAFRPRTRKPILPAFGADEARQLRQLAQDGLAARLAAAAVPPAADPGDYAARLDYELGIITGMNFAGYFLIVADFIGWAKAQGIPVGPGRGSGAGSLVAWALAITDLDPIRFGLLFERFLNPERVSMPDFDIDFCQDRRDEVIAYVAQRWGGDRVAQIITFGKLAPRAALRDVGRALAMPYGQVDRLCKLVPNNPANPVTLTQAIEAEPRLAEARDAEPIVAQMFGIALKLEGLYRHASTHAAGVVIGDRPLSQLVPLYRDPRSPLPVTQFNMKWVEPAGLVKFDFLGLKTLTVLAKATDLLAEQGIVVDLAGLPLDDPAAYALMARGDTGGVFQLESAGMREALRSLKPDRFEDIIAMVSLYRPGPMDNIPMYVARKHGREPVETLHPLIEKTLAETYGVIIYQEQVMEIARNLAGYSLGEADLLRRAMGKKIKAEMDAQMARFVGGAVEKGVPRGLARNIFDLVAKFAGYGFNKSHAAAYALIAYQTAWLKANHPAAFFAASMTLDAGAPEKLAGYVAEAKAAGLAVAPPCVNASAADFTMTGGVAARDAGAAAKAGGIRYALGALRNFGRGAAEAIVAERTGGGTYADLADFARRLDPRLVNARGLAALIHSGALDRLEPNRARLAANADLILATAGRLAADRAAGQSDMFGGGGSDAPAPLLLRPAPAWNGPETLERELDAVGFYLSGHPLDEDAPALVAAGFGRYAELLAIARERGSTAEMRLAASVGAVQERRSRAGNRFGFVQFSDPTGAYEAVVFGDTLELAGDALSPGRTVALTVECEVDGDTVKLRAHGIQPLEQALGAQRSRLSIRADGRLAMGDLARLLPRTGRIAVDVRLVLDGREVALALGRDFAVAPRALAAIKAMPGIVAVELE